MKIGELEFNDSELLHVILIDSHVARTVLVLNESWILVLDDTRIDMAGRLVRRYEGQSMFYERIA